MAVSQLEHLSGKTTITIYLDSGSYSVTVKKLALLGSLGGTPDRPGPWAIVVEDSDSNRTFKVQELASFELNGRTVWFNQYGNITENMDKWLRDNTYSLPLTQDQQTHFTLTWL